VEQKSCKGFSCKNLTRGFAPLFYNEVKKMPQKSCKGFSCKILTRGFAPLFKKWQEN